MGFFKDELRKIKAFAFDVDGVLSKTCVELDDNGKPKRTTNIKDGYALQVAVNKGYPIAIITGGDSEIIKKRFGLLGITDIYLCSRKKVVDFNDFLTKNNLEAEQVLFMGDDLPDIEVMKMSGLATCPNDAVPQVKEISHYISDVDGGMGCVRDVIEQVLRLNEQWKYSKNNDIASI